MVSGGYKVLLLVSIATSVNTHCVAMLTKESFFKIGIATVDVLYVPFQYHKVSTQ